MHSVYLVDPATIGASWATFKELFDRFGSGKGRLINRIPKKWKRMVYESAEAAGVSDGDMARITECLKREKGCMVVRALQTYDPDKKWICNVLREGDCELVRAIISGSETNG